MKEYKTIRNKHGKGQDLLFHCHFDPHCPSSRPQNGGECLRAYVSVALEQVAQWRDEQGNSGLWYVMQVVNQLLDPRTSEFTAAFVGRLVSTLISRAGTELGEQLDQILRAILSKMQQAETLSVMQVCMSCGDVDAAGLAT